MTAVDAGRSPAAMPQHMPLALLPVAAAAAWLTSFYHGAFWAPFALVALTLVAAASLLGLVMPAGGGDGSSDGSSAVSPQQVLQLIKARRSVFPRDFSGDNSTITRQQLELLLEAGRWAPSHKLTEPWHFVVIGGSSKAAFEALTIRCCQELLPPDKAETTVAKLTKKRDKDWPKVHCYIALCMKRHEEVPEWEEMCAVACASQNMLLQAEAVGIHGYWTSWQPVARDSPQMQQLLGIDAGRGDRCLGFFVVGAADRERLQGYRPRRQPLADKVVWRMD